MYGIYALQNKTLCPSQTSTKGRFFSNRFLVSMKQIIYSASFLLFYIFFLQDGSIKVIP